MSPASVDPKVEYQSVSRSDDGSEKRSSEYLETKQLKLTERQNEMAPTLHKKSMSKTSMALRKGKKAGAKAATFNVQLHMLSNNPITQFDPRALKAAQEPRPLQASLKTAFKRSNYAPLSHQVPWNSNQKLSGQKITNAQALKGDKLQINPLQLTRTTMRNASNFKLESQVLTDEMTPERKFLAEPSFIKLGLDAKSQSFNTKLNNKIRNATHQVSAKESNEAGVDNSTNLSDLHNVRMQTNVDFWYSNQDHGKGFLGMAAPQHQLGMKS